MGQWNKDRQKERQADSQTDNMYTQAGRKAETLIKKARKTELLIYSLKVGVQCTCMQLGKQIVFEIGIVIADD